MPRMPGRIKISARTSSVTNSFTNAIIPIVKPTQDEIAQALSILGISATHITCAYCGDSASEWDHLRPLVRNQRPTGFITEIANLVPSCGKCNQSKSGSHWREWMRGGAPQSPATRGIPDIAGRIDRLEEFERKLKPRMVDFSAITSDEEWDTHWQNLDALLAQMRKCQHHADRILSRVEDAVSAS